MSTLSDSNNEILVKLKHEYEAIKLSWIARWFFPSSVRKVLDNISTEQNTIDNAWELCKAFVNTTWFFQRLFFKCLRQFSNSVLIEVYHHLSAFSGKNIKDYFIVAVEHHDPKSLVQTLKIQHRNGCLTDESAQMVPDDSYIQILQEIRQTLQELIEQNNKRLFPYFRDRLDEQDDPNTENYRCSILGTIMKDPIYIEADLCHYERDALLRYYQQQLEANERLLTPKPIVTPKRNLLPAPSTWQTDVELKAKIDAAVMAWGKADQARLIQENRSIGLRS